MTTAHHPRLMGPWMATALVMGNMIGSGVFLLPASLAPLGWNSVYGWLLTIGGTLCLAYVCARMARDMAGGCGPLTYTRAAFGDGAGFIVAWSYWISVFVANATLAVAAISNLSILLPALGTTPGAPAIAAVVVIWIFTIINCLGVRTAGGVQVITTLLKLVPLAGVIGVAAWVLLKEGNGAIASYDAQPITPYNISAAATLTLFALLGFESALVAGDRIANPRKIIPRATLIGVGLTGLIYLLCSSAVTLLLPADAVAVSASPFALFFSTLVHPALGPLVALFAAIAAMGAINGYVLLQGEIPLALARVNLFPHWFCALNRNEIPMRAHILSSTLASFLVLTNYSRSMADLFVFMLLVTTSVSLLFYLAAAASSLKLIRLGKIQSSLGFDLIAVIAFLYSVWTLYGAGIEASVWSAVMTTSGLPVYWWMRRRNANAPA